MFRHDILSYRKLIFKCRQQYVQFLRYSCDPCVIAKTGRHKAQRVILTENAEAIIERKLGWIPER